MFHHALFYFFKNDHNNFCILFSAVNTTTVFYGTKVVYKCTVHVLVTCVPVRVCVHMYGTCVAHIHIGTCTTYVVHVRTTRVHTYSYCSIRVYTYECKPVMYVVNYTLHIKTHKF